MEKRTFLSLSRILSVVRSIFFALVTKKISRVYYPSAHGTYLAEEV